MSGQGSMATASQRPATFASPQETGRLMSPNPVENSLGSLASAMASLPRQEEGVQEGIDPRINSHQAGETLGLTQQIRLFGETPSIASEQLGVGVAHPIFASGNGRKSDNIFNGERYAAQKNLQRLRQENNLPPQSEQTRQTYSQPQAEVSTTRISAQNYDQIRDQQLEQTRKRLKQQHRTHLSLRPASGGETLVQSKTTQTDGTLLNVMTRALHDFMATSRRQADFATASRQRSMKKGAFRKGPQGLDMGGKERKGDAVAEAAANLAFAEVVSAHEWDQQND